MKRLLVLVSLMAGLALPQAAMADSVNVYSARKEALIKPLLDDFSAATGVKVRLITGKADALLKRLEVEGSASPADVFITVDAGRLQRAKAAGVLRATDLAALRARVPAHLRDPDGAWYGLSMRARPIIYAAERVDPAQLSSYQQLADPSWGGRLCLRGSSAVYNQSLTAAMLEAHGPTATQAWVEGMVANLAKPPAGGDIDQLKAVAAGVCDLTLANTYYLGRLLNSKQGEREVGQALRVFWPNQQGRGAHFNVSGAGITRHARNVPQAEALLGFLVSAEAQAWYAGVNNEYPVVPGTHITATLEGFGPYLMDPIPLHRLGELNRAAVEVMDRGGWR